jgi:FtsZ-binding cell division protein ZapB
MNDILLKLTVLFLLSGLVAADAVASDLPLATALPEQQAAIEKEKDISKLKSTNQSLKKEIDDLKNKNGELEKNVQKLESTIQTLKIEIEDLKDKNKELETERQEAEEGHNKKLTETQNSKVWYQYAFYCSGGFIIIIIFFSLYYVGRKTEPRAEKYFDSLVIDMVVDLLQRKMPNSSGDLKQRIMDIVQNHALPDASLSSFSRAEYHLKKVNSEKISLTVTVLYIASKSEVVRLTSNGIISFDDLPKEIRADFIQSRNTEKTYLLYQQ